VQPRNVRRLGRAPYAQLPPEDLALLGADPALRSRYCELAATVLLPPLRRLRQIFSAKSHLNESIAPARLDPSMPGIGRGCASLLGTLSAVYFQLGPYAAQFESLAARWQEELFDLLQPDAPGLHIILKSLVPEQIHDGAAAGRGLGRGPHGGGGGGAGLHERRGGPGGREGGGDVRRAKPCKTHCIAPISRFVHS
jgi:hypothetical protein